MYVKQKMNKKTASSFKVGNSRILFIFYNLLFNSNYGIKHFEILFSALQNNYLFNISHVKINELLPL